MSFYHDPTGTTYDQLPRGADVSEFRDIGERPSPWHYWDAVAFTWAEDTAGKTAADARGF